MMKKKVLSVALALLMTAGLAACGGNSGDSSESGSSSSSAPESVSSTVQSDAAQGEYGTVTIDNNGREITFTKMPERVISMNIQTTEMMLALGLEDKLIGTSYNNCEVLPEYKEAFDQIPILADEYASHEVIIGQEPDFVIGRNTAFSDKQSGSIEQFEAAGIPAYQAKGTVVSGRPENMDDVYEDISNLGKIFQVEDRADALIQEMQGKIDAVQQKVASVEQPLKVLVIDGSIDGNEIFTASNALETELIRLAGGENIAPDMGKNWASISMEIVADANPDVIVFNLYDDTVLEDQIAAAQANETLQDTNAVKNQRFVGVQLTSVHESIRTADTVQYLAENFYPELFS